MHSLTENDEVSNLYYIRKESQIKHVKGLYSKKGNTIRAQINGANYYNYNNQWGAPTIDNLCSICNVNCCNHTLMNTKQYHYRHTADSRFQYKNVRQCDICSTHACSARIHIRGRKITITIDDISV